VPIFSSTASTGVRGFPATDYSVDSSRGKKFAHRAGAPPLPVLIRYLCEFFASDVAPGAARLQRPLLLIRPLFTEVMRANAKRIHLASYFGEPWRDAFENRADTTMSFLDGAGILSMDDKPGEVDRLMAGFLNGANPKAAAARSPKLSAPGAEGAGPSRAGEVVPDPRSFPPHSARRTADDRKNAVTHDVVVGVLGVEGHEQLVVLEQPFESAPTDLRADLAAETHASKLPCSGHVGRNRGFGVDDRNVELDPPLDQSRPPFVEAGVRHRPNGHWIGRPCDVAGVVTGCRDGEERDRQKTEVFPCHDDLLFRSCP
jgi:hypothetical protein